jgi:hypothetical protein
MGITPDGPFDVPFSKNKVLAAVSGRAARAGRGTRVARRGLLARAAEDA